MAPALMTTDMDASLRELNATNYSAIVPAPRSFADLVAAPKSHHLLDLDLNVFSSEAEAAEHATATAAGARSGLSVFTCNVDHLMMVRKNPEFRSAYERADVVTIDGAPLALLSRWTGTTDAARVTGVALTEALVELAAVKGLKLALIGGAPGRGAAAARNLAERHPDLPHIFVDSPLMGFKLGDDEDDRLVKSLQGFRPDIVIVCLGAPKQELWIDRHRNDLPGSVLVGAGATIDFLSGAQTRAPRIFQRTGTEALYRLATDFRRLWRRYLLRDAVFLAIFVAIVFGYIASKTRHVQHADSHTGDWTAGVREDGVNRCGACRKRGRPNSTSLTI
ncbi:WecB/TagA/CpsF family glycosyltransferase [Actinomycetospora callitridis]|uniref:WecB/TagA/CpsF family glycosyltransferase n=1 Tax=Actinomycetospora callitridis TaxID=913944 RepID=UPI002365D67B|nr:WecB/TagA/CpsF family glycosyltransferase [Actinomycetospora callitridis]MDD7917653.1 WecB/TagA/CpsF family glycosyltransferase [Actinomycetospora callitridis]